ncbi:S-layer-like y domain-containing protein [Paenibacillus sediminis]|uniref:SLH domain-containing protein n=1 Tax=Paenibacillus sediminis TaxID=664909 RepID=A0ABS4GZY9_9BACL|nr:S-layer homology domain-containing protein [Paenibacillus sediminis]MBP1935834.1 hypothetical protein [Paenibacillus sediminis]
MVSNNRKFNHSKKMLSAMLAAAMSFSGGAAVFADTAGAIQTSQTAPSVSLFSDVKSGFWAEKHIYKLAAQGIVKGNNGQFRPNDNVTQQEAITMAIRFMNLEGSLTSGTNVVLPDHITAGDYYKPYIALAFQQNLLNKDEEEAAVNAEKSGKSWGEQKASREWITKIIVRALGKKAEAEEAKNTATSFVDNSQISASARGYINVALNLNLTKGIEGNRFDPLGSVTRAQLATFFSRGQAYVNPGYSNEYEGVVTGLTNQSITLYVNGKSRIFTLGNNTVYYTSTSDNKVQFSDLKLYTKVSVIDSAGAAAYVETTDATPQLESVEGSFIRVAAGNKLWLFVDDNPASFTFDSGTVFLDQNGIAIKADNIAPDSEVEVQRETFSAEKKPIIVRVKSGSINKTSTGTIQSVDLTNKTVTLNDASGATEQYKLNDLSIIRYQNELLNLDELKIGSTVKYAVVDSVIQSIEVTKGTEYTVRGSLFDIGPNQTTITYKKDDGLDVKLLAKDVQVVINGVANPTLDDLIADSDNGDQVELTLNAQNEVTRIEVLNRQMKVMNEAIIDSYNPKTKVLTVLDSKKTPHVFTLDAKTKLDYDSKQPTLAGIEPQLTEGRKINISYIDTRALSLQIVYKYEGTFVSANTSDRTITILQADGKSLNLSYGSSTPMVEWFGKTNAVLSDLSAGTKVVALLNSTQTAVSKLTVQSVAQFEVVSVDNNYRVRVKANGVTSEFYIDQPIITSETGQLIKAPDLRPGQTINVILNGTLPVSVQVVKITVGKVTNIDSSGQTVTVQSGNGKVESFSVTGGVKVDRSGITSSSVTALTVGDRVEARKDVDGKPIFKVLTSSSKLFWKYDTASGEIYVKRDSTMDNNYRFKTASDVFVHQGDTNLTVQTLRDNDKIVLYFNNDVIVEIEKQ